MQRQRGDERSHFHGHRQRLRERFLKSGLVGFAEYEVELLLTLAVPRADVKPLAKTLLEGFGSIRAILDAPPEEMRSVKGVGEVAPVALRIIREAATLYLQQSAEGQDSFAEPDALTLFWRSTIGALPNEVFQVGYLDSGCRLLRDGVETLEEGTTDRAAVYPRRVIEAALRRGAAALVFAHNHPNGNVEPSEQDKTLTRALVLAATTVQITGLGASENEQVDRSQDQTEGLTRPRAGDDQERTVAVIHDRPLGVVHSRVFAEENVSDHYNSPASRKLKTCRPVEQQAFRMLAMSPPEDVGIGAELALVRRQYKVIQGQDFRVVTPPERTIGKECALRSYCVRDGVVPPHYAT